MKISRGFTPLQLTSRVTAFQVQAFIAIVLTVGALVPRVSGLADFITTDEAYHWITRTERFNAALARQNWSETIQTGHPGVTIMWLGSLGLALEHVAVAQGWANIHGPV